MKKMILSILIALLATSLAVVTASAAETAPSPEEAQEILAQIQEDLSEVSGNELRGRAKDEAAMEALEKAGWHVKDGAAQPAAQAVEIDQETYNLAYSDLDSATPEMKEKIRAAREKIIFSSSGWTAYEASSPSYVVDLRTKEITIQPRFQDLFPGWEVPGESKEPADLSMVEEGLSAAAKAATKVVLFNNSVPLKHPGSTTTAPFYNAPTSQAVSTFSTYANLLVTSTSFNLGYSLSNGNSLGYAAGLGTYQAYVSPEVITRFSPYVGVRASTNTKEGSGWMVVSRVSEDGTPV